MQLPSVFTLDDVWFDECFDGKEDIINNFMIGTHWRMLLIVSSFGGMAATRPALCADIWGLKNGPGVLSARQLSVVLPASAAGPAIVSHFRGEASHEAIV